MLVGRWKGLLLLMPFSLSRVTDGYEMVFAQELASDGECKVMVRLIGT